MTGSNVLADYPNELLLNNIEANVRRNEHLLGTGRRAVRGHLWGSDTAGLLKCLEELPRVEVSQPSASTTERAVGSIDHHFDVAVVAECLWLHHLVGLLLSLQVFLPPYWLKNNYGRLHISLSCSPFSMRICFDLSTRAWHLAHW